MTVEGVDTVTEIGTSAVGVLSASPPSLAIAARFPSSCVGWIWGSVDIACGAEPVMRVGERRTDSAGLMPPFGRLWSDLGPRVTFGAAMWCNLRKSCHRDGIAVRVSKALGKWMRAIEEDAGGVRW